jgi:hypothetical protein
MDIKMEFTGKILNIMNGDSVLTTTDIKDTENMVNIIVTGKKIKRRRCGSGGIKRTDPLTHSYSSDPKKLN